MRSTSGTINIVSSSSEEHCVIGFSFTTHLKCGCQPVKCGCQPAVFVLVAVSAFAVLLGEIPYVGPAMTMCRRISNWVSQSGPSSAGWSLFSAPTRAVSAWAGSTCPGFKESTVLADCSKLVFRSPPTPAAHPSFALPPPPAATILRIGPAPSRSPGAAVFLLRSAHIRELGCCPSRPFFKR